MQTVHGTIDGMPPNPPDTIGPSVATVWRWRCVEPAYAPRCRVMAHGRPSPAGPSLVRPSAAGGVSCWPLASPRHSTPVARGSIQVEHPFNCSHSVTVAPEELAPPNKGLVSSDGTHPCSGIISPLAGRSASRRSLRTSTRRHLPKRDGVVPSVTGKAIRCWP